MIVNSAQTAHEWLRAYGWRAFYSRRCERLADDMDTCANICGHRLQILHDGYTEAASVLHSAQRNHDTKGGIVKITIEDLQKLNACKEAIDAFARDFPEGINREWDQVCQYMTLGNETWRCYWGWAVRYGLIPSWSMSNANFHSADLRAADLRYADMSFADLRNADLRGANLENVDMSNADLRGANLKGANLFLALLPDPEHLPTTQNQKEK